MQIAYTTQKSWQQAIDKEKIYVIISSYNKLTFANEIKWKRGIIGIFDDIFYKDGEVIDNSWIK